MFSGYSISIQVNGQTISEQFVIPAILDEAIAEMIATFQAQDPHDQYAIMVRWEEQAVRPLYVVEPAIMWPTENASRAFAEAWANL